MEAHRASGMGASLSGFQRVHSSAGRSSIDAASLVDLEPGPLANVDRACSLASYRGFWEGGGIIPHMT